VGIIIKLAQMRKDVMRKMIRAIGKGKLMEMLLWLDKMTDRIPMDKLGDVLDKCEIELGMKGAADDINALLSVGKALHEPDAKAALEKYKQEHDYGVLHDKKHWNELRNDPGIDKALGSLVDHLVGKYHDQVMTAQQKGNVAQIKELVARITSDNNIIKNRAKRKKIETFNEILRTQEKDIDLKRISKELYDMFKVKDKK